MIPSTQSGAWPMKEEDCDCLNRILADIATLSAAIQKCKSCNMPVDDQAARLESMRQLVAGIKAQFFPGRE